MTLKEMLLSKAHSNNVPTEQKPVTEQETAKQQETFKEQKLDDWLIEYKKLSSIVEKSKKDWRDAAFAYSKKMSEAIIWLDLGISLLTLSKRELTEEDRDKINSHCDGLIGLCISKYTQIKTIPEEIKATDEIISQAQRNIDNARESANDLVPARREIESLYNSCGEGEIFNLKLEANHVKYRLADTSEMIGVYEMVNHAFRDCGLFKTKLNKFEELAKAGKCAHLLDDTAQKENQPAKDDAEQTTTKPDTTQASSL